MSGLPPDSNHTSGKPAAESAAPNAKKLRWGFERKEAVAQGRGRSLDAEAAAGAASGQTSICDGQSSRACPETLSPRDIERLGRERPPVFHNAWTEIAFVFSIVMSQVLAEYFISGFNVVLPTLLKELAIPEASSVWPASAFSLVIAATLLIFGRLADMIGGFPIYVFGMGWLFVWSVIAGFSINRYMLIFCRALQGIGPAAYLPSSMMLLAKVYRPGPRKNLVFSIYGTCAVIGFFFGIFCSGVSAQFLSWGWYFWIGAILAAVTTISSYVAIPSDVAETRKHGVKMDYLGGSLIVPGLTLVVFAITDSAHAPDGWRTPMVYIMGGSPMQIVVWCVPMVIGGFVFPLASALFLHIVSGTVLLIISGIGWVATGILFALMPEGASYWAFAFPAMIGATLGIDITFNITNIFITTSQPARRQGLAGAVINSVLHLSIAFLLGFADIAQIHTAYLGRLGSYRVVFWFQVGCAAVSLLVIVFFVRVDAAKSEMTADERLQLMEMEQVRQGDAMGDEQK
ncbi:hypothetical protein FQN50_004509 [Emmonsiellopsis sp. PD_5]|nr:hypothetical protein FQN50_004509 [Emmonsiellopsis sp. PD_5]